MKGADYYAARAGADLEEALDADTPSLEKFWLKSAAVWSNLAACATVREINANVMKVYEESL